MKELHPYTETRRELQALAAEIEAERNKLSALIGEYTRVALVAAEMAERLLLPSLDERGQGSKVRAVVYESTTPKELVGSIAPSRQPSKNSSGKLGAGKRACSICRKPGHRATTCPEAP